jgi:hypothetical protein
LPLIPLEQDQDGFRLDQPFGCCKAPRRNDEQNQSFLGGEPISKRFGPPYGRPKSPFFGGQRKVTQRKPTPRRPWMAGVQEMQEQFPAARALRTFPVLRVRAPATGLADSTSVCWQLTGPHRVGPPADISYAVAPRARGPDGHGWPECRKCRSNFLPIWWPSWPRPQAACFE